MATKTRRKPVNIDAMARDVSFDDEAKAPAPPPKDIKLDIKTETITPDIARQYLGVNFGHNRKVISSYVRRYADDMAGGRWRFEASDPIRFNINGELIDGQHRLHAVVATGIATPFIVIRGIPVEAIHVIDTGKARSPSDALKISGFHNTVLLASALRHLLIIKDGPLQLKTPRWRTHSDIIAAAQQHKDIIPWVTRIRPVRGVRPSQVVTMSYVGDQLLGLPDTAHRFMTVFNTGVPDYEGCPAHRLREQLIASAGHKGNRASSSWSLMMMAHVWNLFAKRKAIQQLKPPLQVSIDGLDSDLI
jgi:hypothetical protein